MQAAGNPAGGRPPAPRRAGAWVLLALAALTIGSAVLSYRGSRDLIRLAGRADEAVAGVQRLSTTVSAVQAAGSAYLLTLDPGDLAELRTRIRELLARLDGLATVAIGEDQQALLEQARAAAAALSSRAEDAAGPAASGQPSEARAVAAARFVAAERARLIERLDALAARVTEFAAAERSRVVRALRGEFLALLFFVFALVLLGGLELRRLAHLANERRAAGEGLDSERMAETVQRFELALRAANIAVFSQDAERRFTWISREAFGLDPSQIVGRTEEEVLAEDICAIAIPAKKAVLSTGQPQEYEYSAILDGERRWYRARAEPVVGADGKPTGIVGAVIDVTTEHFAQQRLWSVTDELAATVARFDIALRGADVFVFTQDRERRLTFVSDRIGNLSPLEVIGKRDEDVTPPEIAASLVPLKELVLRTGAPQQIHLSVPDGDGEPRWLKVRVEAQRDGTGVITGLIGCAVDITAERLGQQRERRLADELRTTVQRFQVALQGADVTVFTQDRDLVYTWVSQEFLNRDPASIIGRTDRDVLPEDMSPNLLAFKSAVLSEGEPKQGEFRFPDPLNERWYFVHAEPQRDENGAVVGLLAAAVDVTERRQRETHIRILLRELTHRTKNLLAVVQAMARQTLTTSTSARDFEARFSGRLQGLASSLDILVNENWEGASLEELVLSQLGHYRDFVGRRIMLSGPDLRLEPEAAQNIGLALHELGTNSSKYGALSVPGGRVEIGWEDVKRPEGSCLRFFWKESGGPPVQPPTRKGFGLAVLERLVPRALGGRAELSYGEAGFCWSIEIAGSHVRGAEEGPRPVKVWAG